MGAPGAVTAGGMPRMDQPNMGMPGPSAGPSQGQVSYCFVFYIYLKRFHQLTHYTRCFTMVILKKIKQSKYRNAINCRK